MMSDLVEPKGLVPEYETAEPILFEVVDGVAWITMNRPSFNNAQNGQMTYALDDAFQRATNARPCAISSISISTGVGSSRSSLRPDNILCHARAGPFAISPPITARMTQGPYPPGTPLAKGVQRNAEPSALPGPRSAAMSRANAGYQE